MNDFTKEELEYLLVWEGQRKFTSAIEKDVPLIKKIQSMIDNYCEHTFENGCCNCSMDSIYCTKCGKDLGEFDAYN